LTEHGGQTEVGGGEGGFHTADEYTEIVEYAADRFMIVVPEIDVPGHTNAALSSYAELNCDGVAPELFTGTEVGFSALCVGEETTYSFLEDVIREIAALTPGRYFHVGGDEVERLSEEDYVGFIHRVQSIVGSHGKRMIGWDEVALADLEPGSIVQLWRPLWPVPGEEEPDSARAARAREFETRSLDVVDSGAHVILSPADLVYLDLKYDSSTALGLTWAGIPNVRDAYDWDIGARFSTLPEEAILGVEAPLWSETVATIEDFEYMAFPRLAGVAELGWSLASATRWDEYRMRLGAQSARWTALGVNFRRSPLVPWEVGPADP
jgi:hexosaminidase